MLSANANSRSTSDSYPSGGGSHGDELMSLSPSVTNSYAADIPLLDFEMKPSCYVLSGSMNPAVSMDSTDVKAGNDPDDYDDDNDDDDDDNDDDEKTDRP
ncbi:hypothetical protein CSUB01_04753 [Colletotrichum sublineola]|uniref:Uncharacterized protein n=1 Tax=Colletotrichum sublineola TaxID=1173701 RepID=A0A066XFV9_COLSU|nr:hypothetical protein CSUB01_04753 [Colletotrichum sublineola]